LTGQEDKADGVEAVSWALKGFDYQAAVSVWLAVDLMVANRLASEKILKHVSEEDIEAEVEEFDPDAVTDAVSMKRMRNSPPSLPVCEILNAPDNSAWARSAGSP